MRYRNWVRVALAFAVAFSVEVTAAPVPHTRRDAKDAEKLCGEWTLVRHVQPDGTVVQHEENNIGNSHFLLRISNGKVEQEYDFGDPSLEIGWDVKLDFSATPKRIDLTVADVGDPWKGKVRRGIYQFDGERLILALAAFDEPAPVGFKPGRDRDVFELKRVGK